MRFLGPADALGHRGFGNHESSRDLCGGKPTDGAQRERELRSDRERGMAAQEQECERIVLLGCMALARQVEDGRGLHSILPRALASPRVDEASRCDR